MHTVDFGRLCRKWLATPALAVSFIVTAVVVAPASTTQAAATPPSQFVPVTPCRLLDTRLESGRLTAGGSVDVTVIGERCDIPDDANAAALTITVDRPGSLGYAAVWPAGDTRPETSVLNYRAGQTVANSQLVQLGSGGAVSVYSLAATDLIVDVTGYFVSAGGAVSTGRYVPVEAERVIDTRLTTRPAKGGTVRVQPDVPDDAVAVAVNLTTAESSGPGFFTVYPAGGTLPIASVLNTDGAGQARAASVIVPVNDDGFDVYTLAGDHVIVDLTGYFTGPSASASTSGLFVANSPARLVDTRLAWGASGGPRLWDAGAREFAVTSITGGPVAALAVNITMTETEDFGFVAASPARVAPHNTSNVNASAAQTTVANSAIVQASTAGVMFTTLEATHLVVDVMGWFTGSPVAASGAAPSNTPPPDRRVTVISDSAMAGVRWNGALGGFQGFIADDRLESCRRLVQYSCRGREGYAPRTAQAELLSMPQAGPEDIVVIATGYNDWHERFSSDFDAVIAAARARGFHHIAWVTYRANGTYSLPGSGLRSNYNSMNAVLRSKVASGAYPEVRLWDLEYYTLNSSGWFRPDGVHEYTLGSWGVADWISRHVRALDDRPCAQPMSPGAPVPDPCPNPDTLPSTVGFPDISGLYGV